MEQKKYQGKEFTASVQAPNKEELMNLLSQFSRFAEQNKLEKVSVVHMGPDPDGGWEAVIKAHNWNPVEWVKGKFKKKPTEEPLSYGPSQYQELQAELERERAYREKEEKEFEEAKKTFDKTSGPGWREKHEAERTKTAEEILKDLPEKERGKYKKRIEAGERSRMEAELEVWESGVPGKKKKIFRDWVPPYTDPKTGVTTPGHHQYKEVEVPMSPQERLGEARLQRLGGMLIEEEVASLKQKKRERGVPYRLARGAGETAKHLTAVGMLGIAGTAQAIQPGRGGPQRASRMLAPRVPLEMYGVGAPSVNLSGLRRPLRPTVGLGGLEHLRGAVLPRTRRRE